MEKYISMLENLPFFAGICPKEMGVLLQSLAAVEERFEKGQVLYRQGDRLNRMGIVLEGSLSLEREDFWGNRSILAVVEAGEVFGEVYACRKDRTLNINVTAQTNTKVLLLDLEPVLERRPEGRRLNGKARGDEAMRGIYARLAVNLVHILAEKTWFMSHKTEYLSGRGIREKVEAYLSAQARRAGGSQFDIPFNRQELADFLSVDRSALSRELGKMKREGILDYRKNHFRLLAAGCEADRTGD